ncbi:MAG: response regulator [bacterium]
MTTKATKTTKTTKVSDKVAKGKRRILIVEDDEFIMYVYEEKFPRDMYEVVFAKDGEEANAYLDKEQFNLVLLDVMMPKINGWEVLNYIRKEKKDTVPVIMISNLAQDSDRDKAKQLGATEYFVKSDMGINDLMEKVLAYVK